MNEIMENQFGIDLQKVITSSAAWSINRMLATKLSIHPYFKIGEVFKSLSDDDIVFLKKTLFAMQSDESGNDAAELYLMMLLLSIGHELQPESDEMMDQWYDELIMFIVCESIARSGAADIVYENMVFGGDFENASFIKMHAEGLDLVSTALTEEQQND
jgi:hypothetical protein